MKRFSSKFDSLHIFNFSKNWRNSGIAFAFIIKLTRAVLSNLLKNRLKSPARLEF